MKIRLLDTLIIGIGLSCFVFTDCGKTPISLPLPYTGSLHIRAEASDESDIDSISVELDDEDFGKHANPYLLTDVIIGTHKIRVKHENTAPKTQTVEILRDETTIATFILTFQGPYVGREAPLFTGQDLEGNSFDLLEHRGKVVLLAFFEHT